jgi:hypothetical protein
MDNEGTMKNRIRMKSMDIVVDKKDTHKVLAAITKTINKYTKDWQMDYDFEEA